MATVRVLVTRPERDALAWAQQLQRSGIEAEAFPLIEIAPLTAAANVQALEQARQALASYCACMFVSGHAVEHFFAKNPVAAQQVRPQSAINLIANKFPTQMPPELRFMAPGPGTVAALVAAGISPERIDAPAPDARQFDSETLWQVIGPRDWQGRRVLVVRGQGVDAAPDSTASSGRDWLARQWAAAGAQVDFLSVYQRRAPTLSAAQGQRAVAASADGSVWLFSSSEAVANLTGLPDLAGVDWSGARAVVTHPRIAETVRALGWGVVVESRPALVDVRAALGSIESAYP
jgi:uroporphyrinogen-III synthase